MTLRPADARWFEMLVARSDLASTLHCLAAGGDVELEAHSDDGATAHRLPQLQAAMDEYRRLAGRYATYWPSELSSPAAELHAEPAAIAASALDFLRAWSKAADPLIAKLQKLQHERQELAYLEQLLSQARALPDFDRLYSAGPVLASRIYLLESRSGALSIPALVLAERIDCGERSYLLVVGPREQMAILDEELTAESARRLTLPATVQLAGEQDIATGLEARLAEIARLTHQLHARLSACDTEHGLSAALGDMALIGWLVSQVPEFACTDHFVCISGWTSDLPGHPRLETSLRRNGIHYLLHFPETPAHLKPPVVLHNPRWAQPFELFARLLGTPGAHEADPSVLLALLVPLMFGFMFGDIGQGAVLVLAGFALRKRYPAAQLLIPGGIAAMVFGALFGSVFAREDIVAALWLRPLQQPLTLLGVSLAGGAVVLLIGLALNALESYWSGQALTWLATRAGLVVSYLASLASFIDDRAAWLIPVGIGWYCIGEVARAEHRSRSLGESIATAIQTLVQLLVNTLSFVRVGAFALAHAGLAAAINALSAGIGPRWLAFLAMALGNAVVILIEGLVVGIQTTRLVLFEFFIRFLSGYGRAFRPLQGLPTPLTLELTRKSS